MRSSTGRCSTRRRSSPSAPPTGCRWRRWRLHKGLRAWLQAPSPLVGEGALFFGRIPAEPGPRSHSPAANRASSARSSPAGSRPCGLRSLAQPMLSTAQPPFVIPSAARNLQFTGSATCRSLAALGMTMRAGRLTGRGMLTQRCGCASDVNPKGGDGHVRLVAGSVRADTVVSCPRGFQRDPHASGGCAQKSRSCRYLSE